MNISPFVFYVAFGQGVSYSDRNENTTGRLWCPDASQVRGPTQEGKIEVNWCLGLRTPESRACPGSYAGPSMS